MVRRMGVATGGVVGAHDEATGDAALLDVMKTAEAIMIRSGDLLRRTFTR